MYLQSPWERLLLIGAIRSTAWANRSDGVQAKNTSGLGPQGPGVLDKLAVRFPPEITQTSPPEGWRFGVCETSRETRESVRAKETRSLSRPVQTCCGPRAAVCIRQTFPRSRDLWTKTSAPEPSRNEHNRNKMNTPEVPRKAGNFKRVHLVPFVFVSARGPKSRSPDCWSWRTCTFPKIGSCQVDVNVSNWIL